jgi:hypothetical protein
MNLDTTLDIVNAFLSPGVNIRAELVRSHQPYARNGAPRRWLGDKYMADIFKSHLEEEVFTNNRSTICAEQRHPPSSPVKFINLYSKIGISCPTDVGKLI